MHFVMGLKPCFLFLLTFTSASLANFPVLDVDTNMRIVLVPYDTPVGTIIYRLRASDFDNNFPLDFEVLGNLGKALLSLNFLGCVEAESLCQADVVLKKALDPGRTYEFQLQVKDSTGDYTKVHATITSTKGSSNFNPLFGDRIVHLAEDCLEGTTIERFEVLKNDVNSRFVHLEIRDKEERIGLKQRLVSNNRTEGTLFLKRKLDYEAQPWFTFQLLAMNGWTNTSVDTRNILVSDILVAVHDVQDTPPVFTLLPASVELNSSLKMGDVVARVEAVDGDKQNKRLIRYGFLTHSNPFVVFFDLDPMNGYIRLRRNISELLGMAKPNEPLVMTVVAEEIVQESSRFGRSTISPTLERTLGNVTFWFGKGAGAKGPPAFSSDKYVGEIQENAFPGSLVDFGRSSLSVSNSGMGEVISLSIRSPLSHGSSPYNNNPQFIGPITAPAHQQPTLGSTFDLIPSQGVGNFSFEMRVKDNKMLDFELYQEIKLVIVATSLTSPSSPSLSSEVEVSIFLRDENDNPPVFSQAEYRVDLPEHSPIGTKVLQLRATDKDKEGPFGQVVFSSLLGSDAFHLDRESGEITVDKPDLLDRELEPEIRLYAEAKDGGFTEFPSGGSGTAGLGLGRSQLMRNMATATIIVKLQDKNDNKPEFVKKYYQAVLNEDMTSFKSPLIVKAFDQDDGLNGQVKYQSLDPKFYVDGSSGEVRVRGSLQRENTNNGGNNGLSNNGPYLGFFKVKAYDLGNPQQSAETIVQLFSEEMVTREIQFVFPATPEKIRKNQTSIEKMLSSLTGGIVGIQKITPFNPSTRSGLLDASKRFLNMDDPNNNIWGDEKKKNPPAENDLQRRSLDPVTPKPPGRKGSLSGRSADLSSSTDKSLVTATVQYPVSATPTRVDLSAFQRAYGGDPSSPQTTPPSHETDMIKLYEAENRALFWILITFLLLLLILFGLFLCCIYCPCCWLYGNCWNSTSKGGSAKVERLIIDKHTKDKRNKRKTYPSEELDTEDSAGGYEGGYRRGNGKGHDPSAGPPRHATRREAWSGDVEPQRRGQGQGQRRYRQERPPTPHNQGKMRGRPPPQEADVSLEDWDFDPRTVVHDRDRAEEIGPRWQNMQHQQGQGHAHYQQMQMAPGPATITVPVPLNMVPLPLQQQIQQMPGGVPVTTQQRRVAYVGHPHPGDEDYVRQQGHIQGQGHRGHDPGETIYYMPAEMTRSQVQIPHHYSHTHGVPPETGDLEGPSTGPGFDSGPSGAPIMTTMQHQRETRFFKTETGEVLQFADNFHDEEEAKEYLIKRYMAEQQQQEQENPPQQPQQTEPDTGPDPSTNPPGKVKGSSGDLAAAVVSDRPRAAIVQKRPHKTKLEKQDEVDQEDLAQIRDEKTKKEKTKEKKKEKALKGESKKKRRSRSEERKEEKVDQKSSKSRSKSSSRSRSLSPKEKVKTDKSKSRSKSPLPEKEKKKRRDVKVKVREKEKVHCHRKKKDEEKLTADQTAVNQEVDINIIPPSKAATPSDHEQGQRPAVHTPSPLPAASVSLENDDLDSGIGGTQGQGQGQSPGQGVTTTTYTYKRNKMLEKKSVFTIAYDEVGRESRALIRPTTGENDEDI